MQQYKNKLEQLKEKFDNYLIEQGMKPNSPTNTDIYQDFTINFFNDYLKKDTSHSKDLNLDDKQSKLNPQLIVMTDGEPNNSFYEKSIDEILNIFQERLEEFLSLKVPKIHENEEENQEYETFLDKFYSIKEIERIASLKFQTLSLPQNSIEFISLSAPDKSDFSGLPNLKNIQNNIKKFRTSKDFDSTCKKKLD